jgi:hypothetical protein
MSWDDNRLLEERETGLPETTEPAPIHSGIER